MAATYEAAETAFYVTVYAAGHGEVRAEIDFRSRGLDVKDLESIRTAIDMAIDKMEADAAPGAIAEMSEDQLRKAFAAFVVEHINETDTWDQDWPQIGHVVAYGGPPCKCGHCRQGE